MTDHPKLAEELEAAEGRIADLETRVAALEKDSHPPVDLMPYVRAEIDEALVAKNLIVRTDRVD